ncbi:unnamed protein product [Brassica oleracea]
MGMAGFTIALMMIGVIISPCVYGKELSDHQEIEVEKLLKLLNKPALKSIKSEDGDIIDCVPIHSQPAFDHPLLKNHTIQMRPSFIPESTSMYTKTNATQVWHKNGRCPENTVPIRRTKKEDILRSKSHESFGKKTTSSVPEYNLSNNHEYAIMNSRRGMYFGTKFLLNVWKPEEVRSNEFSLAQTWLASGDGANINTIEAGLQSGENWWLKVGEELVGFWPGKLFTSLGEFNGEVKPLT